jgi:hypothetical protein
MNMTPVFISWAKDKTSARLVLHHAAHRRYRGDAGQDQEREGDRSGEHVGVVLDERPELTQEPDVRGLGVAEGDEDHVQRDDGDWPPANRSVPVNESDLPHRLFEPRQSSDQEDHDDQQVRPAQPGQASGEGEPSTGRRERRNRLTHECEADRDEKSHAGDHGERIRDPGARRSRGSARSA